MIYTTLAPLFISVIIFLTSLLGVCFFYDVQRFLYINPVFNFSILALWTAGIFWALRTLTVFSNQMNLLKKNRGRWADMVRALYEESPYTPISVVENIWQQIEHKTSLSLLRYVAGSLIFMGLIGTLWGLSETIIQISDVIRQLPTEGISESFFNTLKNHLSKPLDSMGVAFGSSLFGIGSSVTLNFVIMQTERARDIFFTAGRAWSHGLFKNTALPVTQEDTLHRIQTLLEDWYGAIGRAEKIHVLSEKRYAETFDVVKVLSEKTLFLTEWMRNQHHILNKWGEEQSHTRTVLEKIIQKMHDNALSGDEAVKNYLRHIMIASQDIAKYQDAKTEHIVESLRHEIRRLIAIKEKE